MNTIARAPTMPQAINTSRKQTKADLPGSYSRSQATVLLDDCIQSTPESSETSTLSSSTSKNRTPLNRRLTTLYKPLKRYFNSADQRDPVLLMEYKDTKQSRRKSGSFSSPTCQPQETCVSQSVSPSVSRASQCQNH